MKSKHSDEVWLEAARKKMSGMVTGVGDCDYSGDMGEPNFFELRKVYIDHHELEQEQEYGLVVKQYIWVSEKEL